jgi:hypothetical protein
VEESIASTQRDLYGFLEIPCARSRDGDYDCNVEMNFGMGRARILERDLIASLGVLWRSLCSFDAMNGATEGVLAVD